MVPNSSWMTLQKSPQEFIQDNEYFLDQYAIAYIIFIFLHDDSRSLWSTKNA